MATNLGPGTKYYASTKDILDTMIPPREFEAESPQRLLGSKKDLGGRPKAESCNTTFKAVGVSVIF